MLTSGGWLRTVGGVGGTGMLSCWEPNLMFTLSSDKDRRKIFAVEFAFAHCKYTLKFKSIPHSYCFFHIDSLRIQLRFLFLSTRIKAKRTISVFIELKRKRKLILFYNSNVTDIYESEMLGTFRLYWDNSTLVCSLKMCCDKGDKQVLCYITYTCTKYLLLLSGSRHI